MNYPKMASITYDTIVEIEKEKYTIEIKKFTDDEISIEMENMNSKLRYGIKKSAKEIMTLTNNELKMELDSMQFFTVLKKAISSTNNMKMNYLMNNESQLMLYFIWKVEELIEKKMEIMLVSLNVADVTRMSKMMIDLDKYKTDLIALKEQYSHMSINYNELLNKLTAGNKQSEENLVHVHDATKKIQEIQKNNIINVTIFTDNTRRAYEKGKPVFTVKVNKKQKDTILVISATLCVHGESNAGTCQIWTYGNKIPSKNSMVNGQSEGYVNNSGYARQIICSAVIEGHECTGIQTLNLKWDDDMTPFLFINPNSTDHINFKKHQTCSTIRVEEILQQNIYE